MTIKSAEVFEEGQWWVTELDALVSDGSPNQKRAMAVVHNMLSCWRRDQSPGAQEPVAWRRAIYHAEECLTGCLAMPDIARNLDTETVRKIIAELHATRFAMLIDQPMPVAQEPYPHDHPLHKAVFMARESYTGCESFEDGVLGLIAELKDARKAKLEAQRLREALGRASRIIEQLADAIPDAVHPRLMDRSSKDD